MVQQQVYAVYDNRAAAYMHPHIQPSLADAQRSFIHAARDTQTMIGKFPEDYNLVYLGIFDTASGKFTQPEHPETICSAKSCLAGNKVGKIEEEEKKHE